MRVDAGYTAGMTVPQAFDSLLAKLIVTGATREQALERSRRALDEFDVGGMPTVLPFHRAVVRDKAFTAEPFTVHTRWIETEFDKRSRRMRRRRTPVPWPRPARRPTRERIVVEVGGKRLEVVLPAGLGVAAGTAAGGRRRRTAAAERRPGRGRAVRGQTAAAGGDAADQPHAGHDRQDRGRRGPAGVHR